MLNTSTSTAHNPHPIRRLGEENAGGRWMLWHRTPAPALAPFVTGMSGYLEEAATVMAGAQYPDGLVHLIIVLERGFWLGDPLAPGGSRPLESTFVAAGVHPGASMVGSAGDAVCMQVDFTPLGARRFLGVDGVELGATVLDLHELLPALARTLKGRLLELPTWERRFEWLEGHLARRILSAPGDDVRVEHAWRILYRSGGTVPVGALAERLEISRKHLVALFARQIGVPPKAYARIVRFGRAVDLLQAGGPISESARPPLAAVAAACGYADQAHFNRDFRAIAGTTPSAMLEQLADAAVADR